VIVVKGVANPACPATGPGPLLLQSGCDRARHHRPARCVPACRAGRPPRSAPPEHRHRRGDCAARRRRRPGRAPGGCAFPATAPGRTCSRGRLRTAVLITAHARTGETRHPGTLLHIGHYGVARRAAADLALRDQGRLGGLPGLSPYVRAAPNPRALTGRFGASSHVLRSPLQAFLRFPVVCPPVLSPSSASSGFPSAASAVTVRFRSPSVSLRVPFPLSNPDASTPAGRFRGRWSRAARTKVTSFGTAPPAVVCARVGLRSCVRPGAGGAGTGRRVCGRRRGR